MTAHLAPPPSMPLQIPPAYSSSAQQAQYEEDRRSRCHHWCRWQGALLQAWVPPPINIKSFIRKSVKDAEKTRHTTRQPPLLVAGRTATGGGGGVRYNCHPSRIGIQTSNYGFSVPDEDDYTKPAAEQRASELIESSMRSRSCWLFQKPCVMALCPTEYAVRCLSYHPGRKP